MDPVVGNLQDSSPFADNSDTCDKEELRRWMTLPKNYTHIEEQITVTYVILL
jgi:hypothetical protein